MAETSEVDGIEWTKYWLLDVDVDKQFVYVLSLEDGNIYAAPYAVEGDSVTLVRNFKRQVATYRDYVDGSDHNFERQESVYSQPVEQYKALKASYDEAQNELETLRTFHQETIAAQKKAAAEAIFAQFEDLKDVAEFATLKEHAADFEAEALEKECYALRGRMLPKQFSVNKKNIQGAYQALPNIQPSAPTSGLEDIIAHYMKG